LLGVPGLIRSWRAGKVALANAPGAGVADDKVVFAYVPRMIRYYLGEEPLLPIVPSHLCHDTDDRRYVLEPLGELVVKPANESGGYGMLIGPRASSREREKFRALIEADPRNYMAQPTLSLSTAPIIGPGGPVPRHIDLRPFILSRGDTYVTTGGLTRVAMAEGSLVVNSSQGGGAKDTWVVDVGSLLQLELPRSVRFAWRPMIATVGAEELFLGVHPEPDEADVLDFLLLDARNPSSLRSSVAQAREILRSIRDALPQEVWESVNDLHLYLDADGPRVMTRRYRLDFIGRITDGCLKVSGLLQANVSRDIGFQFLRLGTAIEQADMTTRIIDAGASGLVQPRHGDDREPYQNMQWMAVLRAL